MPRKERKPLVTRDRGEAGFLTVGAQRDGGVRLDIRHAIAGGEELHVEAYDYHGRKVSALVIEAGGPESDKHPEIVFRLHEPLP